MNRFGSIYLVGCGNMGAALARGWCSQDDIAPSLHVIDPVWRDINLSRDRWHATPPQQPAADILILAVKPQVLVQAAQTLGGIFTSDTMVISVVAGVSVGQLHDLFPGASSYVRAMPNLPVSVGAGSLVYYHDAPRSPADTATVARLFDAVGTSHQVMDEGLMDTVTAVSGSGPAYVYYFIECLQAAAQAAGLHEGLAQQLAVETVAGAGLLARQADADATTLRESVTSPAGTTQAGLVELMHDDILKAMLARTVSAAQARSYALSQEIQAAMQSGGEDETKVTYDT